MAWAVVEGAMIPAAERDKSCPITLPAGAHHPSGGVERSTHCPCPGRGGGGV